MFYSGTTCWSKTGATSIQRQERGGKRNRDIERKLENDCMLDFLFWDHLLGQNRSDQYIERGERREEKQRY